MNAMRVVCSGLLFNLAAAVVHQGDYTLKTENDLLTCDTISGTLKIAWDYHGVVGARQFPNLTSIGGGLHVEKKDTPRFHFNKTKSTNDDDFQNNIFALQNVFVFVALTHDKYMFC